MCILVVDGCSTLLYVYKVGYVIYLKKKSQLVHSNAPLWLARQVTHQSGDVDLTSSKMTINSTCGQRLRNGCATAPSCRLQPRAAPMLEAFDLWPWWILHLHLSWPPNSHEESNQVWSENRLSYSIPCFIIIFPIIIAIECGFLLFMPIILVFPIEMANLATNCGFHKIATIKFSMVFPILVLPG